MLCYNIVYNLVDEDFDMFFSQLADSTSRHTHVVNVRSCANLTFVQFCVEDGSPVYVAKLSFGFASERMQLSALTTS